MSESFGKHIKKLRLNKELGLREMAQRLGISPTYLSRIENEEDKTSPAEEVIVAMAKMLDVQDVDVLMQMAGRISHDVKDMIVKQPGLPQALRTAHQNGIDIQRLIAEATKKGGG